ncbi:MAG: hypothetical protein ACXWJB_04180 [Limisphaerales bacterium]
MGNPVNNLQTSLFKRNISVGVVAILTLSFDHLWAVLYLPPWQLLALLIFCCFCWANAPLFKAGYRLSAFVLSAILVILAGVPGGTLSILLSKYMADRDYSKNGFQIVEGCNGAAANSAENDVYQLQRAMDQLNDSRNTNILLQLKAAQMLAKEKANVLDADCRKRGHRENHPWKTNWSGIKQTLAAADKIIYDTQ